MPLAMMEIGGRVENMFVGPVNHGNGAVYAIYEPGLVEQLGKVVYADGTFSVVPAAPQSHHVFTIHMIYERNVYINYNIIILFSTCDL